MHKYIHILIVGIFFLALFNFTSVTEAAVGYPVKVFFTPIHATQFDQVVPVVRYAPTLGVARFAVEQLIAGPTPFEHKFLFSQLHDTIDGPSNCAGQNFTLSLSSEKATLKFCRMINSGGIGDDARITTEVSRTLKQFQTVKKVVILTKDGNCFGDMSGMNVCLK